MGKEIRGLTPAINGPFFNFLSSPYQKEIVQYLELITITRLTKTLLKLMHLYKTLNTSNLKPYIKSVNFRLKKKRRAVGPMARNIEILNDKVLAQAFPEDLEEIICLDCLSDHVFNIPLSSEDQLYIKTKWETQISRLILNVDSKIVNTEDGDAIFDKLHVGSNQCSLKKQKIFKLKLKPYTVKCNQPDHIDGTLNICALVKAVWECPENTNLYKIKTLSAYIIPSGIYASTEDLCTNFCPKTYYECPTKCDHSEDKKMCTRGPNANFYRRALEIRIDATKLESWQKRKIF